MKKSVILEKYPISSFEIDKSETHYKHIDEIVQHFKDKIENDPVATYIATFDHYEHTKSLENHEIADNILSAINIVFCFGQKIPNPLILSVRPRSFAIVEDETHFTVSFMDAPMKPANDKMIAWTKDLVD